MISQSGDYSETNGGKTVYIVKEKGQEIKAEVYPKKSLFNEVHFSLFSNSFSGILLEFRSNTMHSLQWNQLQ